MKFLLGGFNANVDREDIFKPKLEKKNLIVLVMIME
jgi:hypothetical protein